ncbi:MAG TPA: phenylacetate--CoA ligase family protein [Thermoplasmatales archaeon]|nr:phenylacetate--CoA ligase family protein [Thermoplasmatales archaeon]
MGYRDYLKELERSQWFQRKDLEKLQLKKLRSLLMNSYKYVPYYRKLFRSINLNPSHIRGLEDLSKIPILRRESIKMDYDDLISRNVNVRKLIPDFTSGSTTGERLKITRVRETYDYGVAAELRAYEWYGIERERFYYILGADYDVENNRRFRKRVYNFLTKTLVISPLEFSSKERLRVFLDKMSRCRRRVIYGTPSGVCRFTRFLEEYDVEVNIDCLVSTDELLLKQQRKFLTDFFDCEVYDIYGTSEVWGVAFECNEHGGYHVSSENVIVEVVDENWERVSPGERGRILLTDLNNCEMPVIRYDIGDFGILSDEECGCGRGLHLMKPIDGQMVVRDSDYLVSMDGKRVFVPSFGFLLEDYSRVKQFQIVQKKRDEILVRVVRGEKYKKDEMEGFICGRICGLLGAVSVEFEYLDDILPDRNGKHRYLVRNHVGDGVF